MLSWVPNRSGVGISGGWKNPKNLIKGSCRMAEYVIKKVQCITILSNTKQYKKMVPHVRSARISLNDSFYLRTKLSPRRSIGGIRMSWVENL